jgi:hypothetical protein
MQPEGQPIPEELRRSLDEAEKVAKAVDDAIMKAEPGILDLQVAAAPSGRVVISGIAPSPEAAVRASKAAESVVGVRQLLNSLTVA